MFTVGVFLLFEFRIAMTPGFLFLLAFCKVHCSFKRRHGLMVHDTRIPITIQNVLTPPINLTTTSSSNQEEWINNLLPHWKCFRNDRSHEFSDLNLWCSSRLTDSTCLSQKIYHPSLQHGIFFLKWVFLLYLEETSSRWRRYEWMHIAWHWIQLCFKH